MSFCRHGKSIKSDVGNNAGGRTVPAPSAIGFDEFQLAIPWRVGLHQIPLPLHQPAAGCSTLDLPVEHFSANGKHGLIRLSQRRGPPHADGCLLAVTEQGHHQQAPIRQDVFRTFVWNLLFRRRTFSALGNRSPTPRGPVPPLSAQFGAPSWALERAAPQGR